MRKIAVAISLLVGLAHPAVGQVGSGPTEVPLRMGEGRLIVPVVASDGTQLDFALTTGAGVTLITESTVAQLGDSPDLTLGGLPVPMEGRIVVPDDYLTTDGRAVAGLISPNLLNSFNVLLDVPGGRMVLKPFGRSVEWDGVELSDPLPVQVFHGTVLYLDVSLNGTSYPATIDLGTSTVVVNERVKAELELSDDDSATLAFAGATLPNLAVRTLDLEVFDRWSPNGDGFVIVGASLASHCAIAISWVHQEVRTCVQ